MHKTPIIMALMLIAASATADMVPIEPGWSAHKVADGFSNPTTGLAHDPQSGDLFVGDGDGYSDHTVIWRVTPAGAKTAIVVEPIVPEMIVTPNIIAFDATARVLYVMGFEMGLGLVLRRFTENGAFIDQEPVELTGIAIGPDGALYGVMRASESLPVRIVRRDPGTGDWTVWRTVSPPYDGMPPALLCFDPSGMAFVTAVQSGRHVYRVEAGATIEIGWDVGGGIGVAASPSRLHFGPRVFDPGGGNQGPGTFFVTTTGWVRGVVIAANGTIYMTSAGPAPGGGELWALVPDITPATGVTWGALKARYR